MSHRNARYQDKGNHKQNRNRGGWQPKPQWETENGQYDRPAVGRSVFINNKFPPRCVTKAALFSGPTVLAGLLPELQTEIYFYCPRGKPSLKHDQNYSFKFEFGELKKPEGAAFDDYGNLFVSDSGNNEIKVFKPDGTLVRSFGSRGSLNGQFRKPCGIAFDYYGRVAVVDSLNHRVQIFTQAGLFKTTFGKYGSQPGEFLSPEGIGVDNNGNLLICDTQNDRVQVYSPTFAWLASVGKPGINPGDFMGPSTLDIDQRGNIFVAESCSCHVAQIFSWDQPTGTAQYSRSLKRWAHQDEGHRHHNPEHRKAHGVAVDSNGYLITAGDGTADIKVYSKNGKLAMWLETSDFKMQSPTHPVLDKDGNIYVLDEKSIKVIG